MLKDNGHAWGGVWYGGAALVGGGTGIVFVEKLRGLLSPEDGT